VIDARCAERIQRLPYIFWWTLFAGVGHDEASFGTRPRKHIGKLLGRVVPFRRIQSDSGEIIAIG
jgi:hypothetical protein